MKKIKRSTLSLSSETIRVLDDVEMRDVAGGWPSADCNSNMVGCQTYSVNPCAGGPTVSLCVTYVQRGCH